MRAYSSTSLLLILLTVSTICRTADFPPPIQRALEHSGIPRTAVSLIVQPLDSSEPLVNVNPLVARNPASIIKLVTSYSALSLLGIDYRWPTDIYVLGTVENAVLKGDLGIKGYGDPLMLIEDFWLMLGELRRRGINKIDGNLILDSSFFAPIDEDAGSFDLRPDRTYNLKPNALMVNFQTVQFILHNRGASAGIDMVPDLPNLRIKNRLRSIAGPCALNGSDIAISVNNSPRRDLVSLDGQYAKSCSEFSLSRTVLEPDTYFFGLFKRLWQQGGGELTGTYQSRVLDIDDSQEPFMRLQSRPFREVLAATNKFSNNSMARHLLLSIAAEQRGAPAKIDEGIAAVDQFLRDRGMDTDRLELQNGSGLSRKVRVDAQLIMDVLQDANRSALAAEFIASLPINGVDGTMRSRFNGAPAEGMAHVKTGRLDDVVTLAGIVQSRAGKPYALVFMMNHKDVHLGIGNDIGDTLINWIYNY